MQGRRFERVWRALADPTRRRLIDLLSDQARTTGDLAAAIPRLSRFAVMKHLRALERAGLVLARRQGRQVWNHLNAVPLREVYERWVGQHESAAAAALLRLKRKVEGVRPEDAQSSSWSEHAPHLEARTDGGSEPRPDFGVLQAASRCSADVPIEADAASVWNLLSASPERADARGVGAVWRGCIECDAILAEGTACRIALRRGLAPGAPAGRVTAFESRKRLAAIDGPTAIEFNLRSMPGETLLGMWCESSDPGQLRSALDFVLRVQEYLRRGISR